MQRTVLVSTIAGLTLVCVAVMVFRSNENPVDNSLPNEKSQDMTKSKKRANYKLLAADSSSICPNVVYCLSVGSQVEKAC